MGGEKNSVNYVTPVSSKEFQRCGTLGYFDGVFSTKIIVDTQENHKNPQAG